MKDMDKEQWLNETLQSLDGMQSVATNPGLYDAVRTKLASPYNERKRISFFPRAAAVAALLLMMLNVVAVLHFSRQQQPPGEKHEVYQVVKDEMKTLTDYNY